MDTPARLVPTLQADELAREIEQQLRAEAGEVTTRAQQQAQAWLAQARLDARARMHTAIADLRREGAALHARAQAQRDTQARARAQQQAHVLVRSALPLLRELLLERWRDAPSRQRWIALAVQDAVGRLRWEEWVVEHPADWEEAQRRELADSVRARRSVSLTFLACDDIGAGLRFRADLAVLDATPAGLLADARTVAALLFDQIANGPP
jgi:hypothetical protein